MGTPTGFAARDPFQTPAPHDHGREIWRDLGADERELVENPGDCWSTR